MGDRENLGIGREPLELASERRRLSAGDPGVHLVEDQRRGRRLLLPPLFEPLDRELEPQIDPRQLAAGSDLGQRPGLLAGVGSKQKHDVVDAVRSGLLLLQGHRQPRLAQPQLVELAADALGLGKAR